jgi:hypothetical protein
MKFEVGRNIFKLTLNPSLKREGLLKLPSLLREGRGDESRANNK